MVAAAKGEDAVSVKGAILGLDDRQAACLLAIEERYGVPVEVLRRLAAPVPRDAQGSGQ